ncbi:hypothetical protein WEH80_05705 [Actinomycetes bacterium KLBMP 9759]
MALLDAVELVPAVFSLSTGHRRDRGIRAPLAGSHGRRRDGHAGELLLSPAGTAPLLRHVAVAR